ncbi:dihydroxyacetone kinase subunit DhaL [Flexivirga sp.]|uniref:dihydroxyacetone kinase subunit DhaL n=1 Tax=Flexivirga sp. TaxID=1962927 RepID=UPI003F7FD3C4
MADVVETSQFIEWMRRYASAIHDNANYLTELDSAIGDADHGSNMDRGMAAVVKALDAGEFDSATDVFKKVGMTLVSSVGGASGPLYGTFFLRLAGKLAEDEIDAAALGAALHAGVEGIVQRGKAEVGDKTMIDAWMPALEAYDAAQSDGVGAALRAAAEAAAQGRDTATDLAARKGRASYLGERSAGHQDPGATSTVLLLDAAVDTLA